MKLDITQQVFITERYLLLELAAPVSFAAAQPGQFLHIRVEDSSDPLLRRPLSIHDVVVEPARGAARKKVSIKILYEVVGKGTTLLSQKAPLSQVDVLGPLGRGFDVKTASASGRVIIVSGGMGVAPLFFLARKIREMTKSKIQNPITVLIGGRNREHIVCEKPFKDLGCEVRVATEDGSKGFKGRVTDLLEEHLAASLSTFARDGERKSNHCKPLGFARDGEPVEPLQAASQKTKKPAACSLKPEAVIYACGPKPMLSAVSAIAQRYELPAQVSLEEFMGCGLGACLGCVIRTTDGYKRICHDGPVFDATHVLWTE